MMDITWKEVPEAPIRKVWTIHYDMFSTEMARVEYTLGMNGVHDKWVLIVDSVQYSMTGRDTIDAFLSGYIKGYGRAVKNYK